MTLKTSTKDTIKFAFIFIMFGALFTSCSNIYSRYESVPDMQWTKADAKQFTFDIKEEADYDMIFALRYATLFPYPVLQTTIEIAHPDGTEFEKDAAFQIIGDNGKYIGEVAGNMWDFESPFSEGQHLKPGKYKVTYTHAMPSEPVIAVMELGLIIRKTEK